MKPKDKLADFRSQELFVGIDVHKKKLDSTYKTRKSWIKNILNEPIIGRTKESYED